VRVKGETVDIIVNYCRDCGLLLDGQSGSLAIRLEGVRDITMYEIPGNNQSRITCLRPLEAYRRSKGKCGEEPEAKQSWALIL
jgi:hypothetical protein